LSGSGKAEFRDAPQTRENALQRPRKGSDVKLLKKSF
jgi:hypothetical protein